MANSATTSPTADQMFESMRTKLARVVPEFELRLKAEQAAEIIRLKRERGAVILGHNYMEPALFHSIPDHTGDSLELCRRAATTDGDPIVFCGVRFMAETAKILNPERKVLLPAREAGCSLAASITADDVRALKARHPGAPVVVYVNTYADVKAEADLCCTSGNAAAVVDSLDAETVIFLPDEFLAGNVAREMGRTLQLEDADGPVGEPRPGDRGAGRLIAWQGRCEVHERFTVEDVQNVRKQFPAVSILAHPECPPDVVDAADFAASTSKMIRFVEESAAPQFLLLTECAMGDNVAAANPDKEMLRMCSVRCPHMNEITLADTLDALRHDRYEIDVPEPTRTAARRSIERMLEIG